jgi:hypothetical protein
VQKVLGVVSIADIGPNCEVVTSRRCARSSAPTPPAASPASSRTHPVLKIYAGVSGFYRLTAAEERLMLMERIEHPFGRL